MRAALQKVVDELNLDISDPFTRMIAAAFAFQDERDELIAELARQNAANDMIAKERDAWELKAKSAEQDAQRYRWLRDNAVGYAMHMGAVLYTPELVTPRGMGNNETDAAIDAAIAAEEAAACDHNWEWMDDWMGDPNVINGTQDLSRWECSKCGAQANCDKRTDPNDAWGER